MNGKKINLVLRYFHLYSLINLIIIRKKKRFKKINQRLKNLFASDKLFFLLID